MIERNLIAISNRTRRSNLALRNDLRNSFRLERVLEKNSLAIKSKLVEERDRTLKGLALRSKQEEKDKKGGVGGALLLGGGGLARRFFGRGKPKVPSSPAQLLKMQKGTSSLSRIGKVGRFGRIGPLAVLGTGLDFAGRKAEGQTNLQAGVGAGGGLAGALAGAKAGAVLGTALGGPIGTVVGGVGGSIIGSLAGGRLADLFTGADRRRKFEERRAILSSEKTLFSAALDDLDRVLDKLEDSDFLGAVRKAKDDEGEDRPRLLPRPIIPFGGAKVDGKSIERIIGEELATYAAIAGVTFLLIPSDPTDPFTTAPLAIKLQALVKSTRLFKALKPIFVKPPKFLQPGKDIPGISAKGIKIRAEALMKKLNPKIKFEPKKLTKKQIEAKKLKDLLKQEKVLQEKLKKLTGSETIDDAKRKAIQKAFEKLRKVTEQLEGRKIKKKFAPNGVFTRPSTKTNLNNLKVEANTNDSDFVEVVYKGREKTAESIALAPTNNIFFIKEGDTNISPPAVFNEGDTIVFGGSKSSSDLPKYVEMTQLFTT